MSLTINTNIKNDTGYITDSDQIQLTGSETSITQAVSSLDDHASSTSNPHAVTKAQVGLGNVDNTSDANKPVSTATQTALDLKANQSTTYTKTEVDSALLNKVNTTESSLQTSNKTVVGAINEVNTAALGAQKALGVANYSTLVTMLNGATASAYKVGQNIYVQTLNVPDVWVYSIESTSVAYTYTTDEALANALNSGAVQMGYYKVSKLETSKVDLSNYRTSAAQDIIDATKANASDLTSHTGNTSNPHSVTKSQVGLGNVDNTSDANKPISTATQTALDAKQNTLTFDNTPTAGSTNPVTSGGVYTALAGKVNTTENSLTTTSKNVVLAINEVNALAASKSAVSVSNTGTATDTVGYITIDGVEKKLAGGDEAAWGNITGTLSNQTDLKTALDAKIEATDSSLSTAMPVDADTLEGHAASYFAQATAIPTKTSDLENDSNFATEDWVEDQGYLTEHQSLSSYYTKNQTDNAISNYHDSSKVDAVSGKGLSTNDYDNTEKQHVADAYDDRHDHSNKSVLDGIDATDVSSWDGKSVVSVSSTGSSTDEVQYITIDGTEKKLAGGGGDDVSFGSGTDIVVTDGTNIAVVANPTLAGTESDLTGLQVGSTKYAIPSGGGSLYRHYINAYSSNTPGASLYWFIDTDSATPITTSAEYKTIAVAKGLPNTPCNGWYKESASVYHPVFALNVDTWNWQFLYNYGTGIQAYGNMPFTSFTDTVVQIS